MEGQDTERRLKGENRWNPTKKQGAVFWGAEKEQKEDKQKNKDKDKANKEKKPTHDRHGNPIDCHPPKSGEPHKRTNSLTGKEELWCGNPKCQRWGSHDTPSHADWFERLHAKRKKGKDSKNDAKPEVKKETTPFLQIP